MKGYAVVRNLVETTDLYKLMLGVSKYCKCDKDNKKAPAFYGNPVMNILHQKLLKKTEEVFDKELWLTYNYGRNYMRGSILKRHHDRPACEYSISLCMGYDGKKPWKIYLKDLEGKTQSVNLKAGDALFYQGTKCDHWRRKLTAKNNLQVFFHYVDKHGPYKKERGDKLKTQ